MGDAPDRVYGRSVSSPSRSGDVVRAGGSRLSHLVQPDHPRSSRKKPPNAPQIPGYRIVQHLSTGGQGTVWKAIRRSDACKVAIKIIRRDRLGDSNAKARFTQECETLRLLDHPGIVSATDQGELPTGELWFVMDYISGESLSEYVQSLDHSGLQQGDADKPAPFPLRPVLALFARICETIQAAHQAGVIHRDLKPSNILVTDDGQPHIVDFGVARAADARCAEAVTLTGEFLGSPEWSSPEQVACKPGQIDVRSDVYSLGVLLYYVLTGQFPYAVNLPLAEVFDHIRQSNPTPPRSLATFIDDELETILLTALAKDRTRRYQSAADFGQDLRRYLKGQPLLAKGDSKSYVMMKFLSRHRVWAAAIVLVCGLTLFYTVTMTVLYGQANAAEAETQLRRRQAQERFQMARQTAEFVVGQVADELDNVPGAGAIRRRLLQQALDRFEALTKQDTDDRALEEGLARSRSKLGTIALDIGDVQRAREHQQAALAIRQRRVAERPDDPQRLEDLSINTVLVGDLANHDRDLDAAEALYRRALDIDERLVREHPDVVHYRDNLAWSYERLGVLVNRRGDIETAAAYYHKRHAIAVQLADAEPDNVVRLSGLSMSHGLLGQSADQFGDYAAALKHARAAAEIADRIIALAPNNTHYQVDRIIKYDTLGGMLAGMGKTTEASEFLADALALARRLVEAEPESTLLRRTLVDCYENCGSLAAATGDTQTAESDFRRAIEIAERVRADDPAHVESHQIACSAHLSLAHFAAAHGRMDLAREQGMAARAIAQGIKTRSDVSPWFLSSCASELLQAQPADLRDPDAALGYIQQAVAATNRQVPGLLRILAKAQTANGNQAAALTTLREALSHLPDGNVSLSAQLRADLAAGQTAALSP